MKVSFVSVLALFCASAAVAAPIQLAHTGRLMDITGAVVDGQVTLVVDVYVAGESTPTHTNSFSNFVVQEGFYSVFLDVDSDTFLSPTEFQVSVDGVAIGPRQALVRVPNAAVADVAARVAVMVDTPVGDCGEEGTIIWSRSAASLFVCNDAGDWAAASAPGSGPSVDPGNFDLGATGATVWTVPADVTSVAVRAWGGGGAGGQNIGATGGGGAYVEATLAVTPGEDLTLQVAEGGVISGSFGSSAGGASIVLRGTTALVVAAGGGGGGTNGSYNTDRTGGAGGAGGGLTGEPGGDYVYLGSPSTYCVEAQGGAGGTQSAGGAGGYAETGQDETLCTNHGGSSLAGGKCTGTGAISWQNSSVTGNGYGGFGGAGYYGGGAGGGVYGYCAGGGGGGSSYVEPSATNTTLLGGTGRNPGEATTGLGGDYYIRNTSNQVINSADVPGQDGRIELSWGG